MISAALPLMLVGARLGNLTAGRVDQLLFNRIVGAVLLCSGAALLFKQRGGALNARIRRGLLQENNGGKRCNSQHQHQPLKVIALQPAGEVQYKYDKRNSVKGVESHQLSPLCVHLSASINQIVAL